MVRVNALTRVQPGFDAHVKGMKEYFTNCKNIYPDQEERREPNYMGHVLHVERPNALLLRFHGAAFRWFIFLIQVYCIYLQCQIMRSICENKAQKRDNLQSVKAYSYLMYLDRNIL